jgi:beta-glucosidase
VQFYASYEASKVARPKKQLVGFDRVAIAHGQSKTVSVPWKSETVAYWDEAQNRFIVEPGELAISVGASSADARLKGHLAVQ